MVQEQGQTLLLLDGDWAKWEETGQLELSNEQKQELGNKKSQLARRKQKHNWSKASNQEYSRALVPRVDSMVP